MDIRIQTEGARMVGTSIMKCAPANVQAFINAQKEGTGMQTDVEKIMEDRKAVEDSLINMKNQLTQQAELVQQLQERNDPNLGNEQQRLESMTSQVNQAEQSLVQWRENKVL